MTGYELKKQTPAFQAGYWDGYLNDRGECSDRWPSERVEYRRGLIEGKDDGYRESGGRRA